MKTKPFFLTTFLALYLLLNGLAEDSVPVQKANKEWQTNTCPQIGLELQLPGWKSDIEDQPRMWTLLAFPLVENPAADVQYRVMISAQKYTESQYQGLIRNPGTHSSGWSNSEHLQTSQMTNAFWIYSRRDIWRTNGFSYTCIGRIKRIQNQKPKEIVRFGGSDEELAAEVRRILDSVEVVYTNVVTKP